MPTAKNAILKAKIEGVIQELMVKTDAANVYIDETTTLASKLTSIIADIATKASIEDLDFSYMYNRANFVSYTEPQPLVGNQMQIAQANIGTIGVYGSTVASCVTAMSGQGAGSLMPAQDTPRLVLGKTYAVFVSGALSYIATCVPGRMWSYKEIGTSRALVYPGHSFVSEGVYVPHIGELVSNNQLYVITTDGKPWDDYGLPLKITEVQYIPEEFLQNAVISINGRKGDVTLSISDVTDLQTALDGKANSSHTHAQSEVTGLTDALALLASTESVNSAIDALRQEMLGDTPVEAYNTFTELAAYISEHQEISDALSAAIGNKADKATTLAGYGIGDAYTKSQVDAKIADAVSNATGGESAASVKTSLDAYKTSNDTRVNALEADSHTHTNKSVLDGISAENVTTWNAKSNSNIYYSSTEPASLTDKDLWVQLV